MGMNQRIDYIKYFLNKWPVLELHGINSGKCTCGKDCGKSAGKHPKTTHGVKDAAIILEDIFDDSNYGVACGKQGANGNYLVVLDVDVRNGGDVTLQALQKAYEKLPRTWIVKTGSNDGSKHYYFQSKIPYASKKFNGIDIQCYGKYVVGPGSCHLSGNYYSWDDFSTHKDEEIEYLPSWIADLLLESEEKKISSEPIEPISEMEYKEKISLLENIPADDHESLVQIGMALKETGHDQRAFYTWKNWASKSTKFMWNKHEWYIKKWNSFSHREKNSSGFGAIGVNAIERIAGDYINIYSEDKKEAIPNLNSDDLIKVDDIDINTNTNTNEQNVDSKNDLISQCPDGLIKDLAKYILTTSFREYPNFALASSFSILATCAQSSYLMPDSRNLSLYQILLIEASGGKEPYLNAMKLLLHAVDPRIICSQPASNYGLRSELYCWNNRIWIKDEVQDFIASLGLSTNNYYKSLAEDLKELYNGLNFISASASKSSITPQINFPRLSFFGVGTPDKFKKAMNSDVVDGGLISRFIIFNEIKKKGKIGQKLNKELPNDLIGYLRRIYNHGITSDYKSSGVNDFYDVMKKIYAAKPEISTHVPQMKPKTTLKITLEAENTLNDYHREAERKFLEGDKHGSIWDRSATNVQKYASLLALSRESEEIDVADVTFAIQIVVTTTQQQFDDVQENCADTEVERNARKIERCLKRLKLCSKSTLQKNTHLDSRALAEGIRLALSMELIFAVDLSGQRIYTEDTIPRGTLFKISVKN